MTSTGTVAPAPSPQEVANRHARLLRRTTRLTVVLAVASAVMLPLLPSLTQVSSSRHQQLAQAAADRATAGGGMLWLDADDEDGSATTAE